MQLENTHNLDDDALGQLLAESFDSLPEPSANSLRKVRDQLSLTPAKREANGSSIHWRQLILIGILSGSGLAFAWWGIDRIFSTQAVVRDVSQPAPASPAVSNDESGNNKASKPGQVNENDERRSPVIYQREQY